jgi:anti-sigma regulatory factor (Ser/Thr protein kinase)
MTQIFQISKNYYSNFRKEIAEFILQNNISMNKYMMEQVVGEVAQNAFHHGYEDKDGSLFVQTFYQDDVLCVLFLDYGKGFNFKSITEKEFSECEKGGGMGLHFLSQLMNPENLWIYSEEGQGTVIILKFAADAPAMKL